jgi:hypothetical protein
MLDGIVPTRKSAKDPTSDSIWLKERVQTLIDRERKYVAFLKRFLNPEELGFAVPAHVRDDVREILGRERVESTATTPVSPPRRPRRKPESVVDQKEPKVCNKPDSVEQVHIKGIPVTCSICGQDTFGGKDICDDCESPSKCESCGISLSHHGGLTLTCAEVLRLRKIIDDCYDASRLGPVPDGVDPVAESWRLIDSIESTSVQCNQLESEEDEEMETLRNRIAELEARVASVNEPFKDVDPDIGVRLTDGGFYAYDLLGSSTGPFRSWREAYRAAEGYKDWLSQQSKIRELEAELSRLLSRQGADDDAEPLTYAWLTATLGAQWILRVENGNLIIMDERPGDDEDEEQELAAWFQMVGRYDMVCVRPEIKTRGDVRRLVAALGGAEREDGE